MRILAGQYYDSETGLYYNWHRYYDPKTGRYISSDPVGLAGGLNTYTYGYNNPLKYIDPDGQNPLIVQGILRLLQIGLGATAIATEDVPILGGGAASKVCKVPKSQALSEIRLTQPGEVFERFESSALRSRVTPEGGLTPGTFAVGRPNSGLTGRDINEALNLPRKDIVRDQRFVIQPPPNTPVIGPRTIQSGSDVEVIFPTGIPGGSVKGPFNVP